VKAWSDVPGAWSVDFVQPSAETTALRRRASERHRVTKSKFINVRLQHEPAISNTTVVGK